LSWKHVEEPGEVVAVGQEVDVEVLDVDLERERISLSLKSTQEDPWEAFARRNAPGDELDGKITKLVSFGVFVEVGDGLEGLVHISELSYKHVEAPAEVVAVGDAVKVKVLDIDPKRRRISLSVKQAMEAPEGYVPEPVQTPLSQEDFLEEAEAEISPEPEAEVTPEGTPEAEAKPEDEADSEPAPPPDTLEAIVRDMKQGS
jgi:small subunit ribosomal protein S1